ncbi:hypothetical protein ABL78_1296 [Leptomonas seymouri]|uniref:C3H1-type domain-containing protein n=1 Tax=Leptomonas seymouri TaxID=5684 RepID=A0A0N1I963_LEPSE|nr:hypothetical protein ABL78_1296 [Leptomonas seymouri]|eukprot:KPI89631.1 hypothetical protein ABL78_1296 [Leptomonas seymouri]
MPCASLPYITCDVVTEPPTTIVIVPCGGQPPELPNEDETLFAVTEDCVEPTKGWLNREGKPLLTVCFMHSFNKCLGRTKSNPATCFQIHIKASVLNALRKHYTKPTRRFFARTLKALLSPDLRQLLCARANKEIKVQYLEYRVGDVFPSTGLLQYEAAYRRWLFSDDTNVDHASTITVIQCLNFAMTGSCSCRTECPNIHADLKKAQVRDPLLARALRDVSDITQSPPPVPLCVPRSLPISGAQSASSMENMHGPIQDGPCPSSNSVAVDPTPNRARVSFFTVAQADGEPDGCLVPLHFQLLQSDTRPGSGYVNAPHPSNRDSFFSPEEATVDLPAVEVISNDTKNGRALFDGKGGDDWVSSSNEGISSSNYHPGNNDNVSD